MTSVLAQVAVTDLDAAQRWYAALFDRAPDQRPVDGLLEWHVTTSAGLQVWRDPDRAGRSTAVLGTDDLDALAARLSAVGLEHGGAAPGGGARLLVLADPDGNRVVVTGA